MAKIRFVLCCILLVIFQTSFGLAATESVTLVSTSSLIERDSAGSVLIALRLQLPEGHYVYGPQEGSMGLPTQISGSGYKLDGKSELPEIPLYIPRPALKSDTPFVSSDDADELEIYAASPTFFLEAPLYKSQLQLQVTVSGLLCSADNCLPFNKTVQIAHTDEDKLASVPPPEFANYDVSSLFMTESGSGIAQVADINPLESLLTPLGQETAPGIFNPTTAYNSFKPQYFQPALEVSSLGSAIFFGLFAGLLLNLMPCVLPVLSLKFSALMAVSTMTDRRQQARAFKAHCLIFALGIMTWFGILSLLFGLAGMAWGQLFQEPLVVCVIALILFLLGLSLFGVFTLPVLDLKASSSANPHWQAFTSGLLATLLATPCSGPLLGGVLGWALQQPLNSLVATILSVGLGMAMPYCIMAFKPRLVNLLPKPGPWTLRLEQLLGFLLMGSVVYLFSQLPEKWMFPFLVGLMGIAFSAWLWGQIGHLGAKPWLRRLARLGAVCTMGLVILIAKVSLTDNPNWEPFEPKSFEAILGKENVLVQFTADWCPSCKALEHTTLNEDRMQRLRSKYDMRTIRVDLTRENEAGQALLEAMGSSSIPVLVLFPKGEESSAPLVVRDLITPRQLKDALRQRF